MALSYKVKKYVNKSSKKNGYFYARAVMLGEVDLEQVADKIQQNCSLKRSDVKAVLTELVEVMTEALQDSKKVRLDGLGTFKLALTTNLVQNKEDFGNENIKNVRVLFQPEYTIGANGDRIVKLTGGTRTQAYNEYVLGRNDKDKE